MTSFNFFNTTKSTTMTKDIYPKAVNFAGKKFINAFGNIQRSKFDCHDVLSGFFFCFWLLFVN